MLRCLRTTLLLLALPLGTAQALTIHDESVDGDLSTNANAPTPLVFQLGGNSILGTVQSAADRRDYITFTIAAGTVLSEIRLLQYEDVISGGGGDRGFHAINTGSTSFVPSGSTAASFLGGAHLDPLPPGTDLLPILAGAPQAGSGFSTPLGPGTYSYLVQQTGPELTAYGFEFVLVPEPSVLALLGAAGLLALGRRR